MYIPNSPINIIALKPNIVKTISHNILASGHILATTATLLEDHVLSGGVLWHLQAGGVVLGSQLPGQPPHTPQVSGASHIEVLVGGEGQLLVPGAEGGDEVLLGDQWAQLSLSRG